MVNIKEKWPLADDDDHRVLSHERWIKRRNRNPDDPSYLDEWWRQQCLMCRFYIRLSGALAEDYGVCSNPLSPFDGIVRFEHDGCEYFDEADDGTPP